jgi:SAM-dependent methyltransferase
VQKSRKCPICGDGEFHRRPVLWPQLINEWQLAPDEAEYIDRQQGEYCAGCRSSLRSMALAVALQSVFGTEQPLSRFVANQEAKWFKVLEINEAGQLHQALRQMPGHKLGSYPDVDLHRLPYLDGSFDVVVHSDTLEHVRDPVHALVECHRVLLPGGALCFTVPIIVGRLSRDRAGLPKSYHGDAAHQSEDMLVHTEFGADAWTYLMRAGFTDVRLFSIDYPAAIAIAAR